MGGKKSLLKGAVVFNICLMLSQAFKASFPLLLLKSSLNLKKKKTAISLDIASDANY